MTKQRRRMLIGLAAVASLTLLTLAPAGLAAAAGTGSIAAAARTLIAVPGDLPQLAGPFLQRGRDICR